MWPRIDEAALLKVLRRCRQLTAESADSYWSCMDTREILASLDRAIRRLQASRPFHIRRLRFLFLPTGPLQETSLDNGWGEEYLRLAALFDNLTKNL